MRRTSLLKLGKMVIISLFIAPILNACAKDSATSVNGVNAIPLASGIFLILALLGGLFYLFRIGKLQKWYAEGVGLGRSKYQASRLSSEKKKIDKTRSQLVDELGQKVWDEKIADPAYAEDWNRLLAMENQQAPILEDVKRLEGEVQRVKEQRDAAANELNRQLSGFQAQVQNLTARLSVLKGSQATAEKNYQSLQQRSNNLIAEIRGIQNKIMQMQASNAPDREQQIFAMNNAIATHNNEILGISNQVPGVQAELTRLRNEQTPLLAEMDRVKSALASAQEQLRQTVPPLDTQLNNLAETIKTKQNEVASIRSMMQPVIDGLGPTAEEARPDNPLLNELYAKIDVEKSKLGSVTSEVDLMQSRIEATDKGSARNFYLMVAGGVLVLAAAIWLIVSGIK